MGLIIVLAGVSMVFHFTGAFFNHDIRRAKREDNSECLLQCIETMENHLRDVNGGQLLRSTFQQSTVCHRYDPQQLDSLCQSYQEAKQCLDTCPDGDTREVGYNALAPLRFMCVDRLQDFKEYSPCLDSVCDDMEKTCRQGCLQYKGAVDKITEIQRDTSLRRSFALDAISKIVEDACEFVDCFTKCSHPLLVEKCGPAAADLQFDTVRKAFSSITQLLPSSLSDEANTLPDSCQVLDTTFEDENSPSGNVTSTSIKKPVKVSKIKGQKHKGAKVDPAAAENDDELERKILLEMERLSSTGGRYVRNLGLLIISLIIGLFIIDH